MVVIDGQSLTEQKELENMKKIVVLVSLIVILGVGTLMLASCRTTGGKSGASGGEFRQESTPNAGSGSRSQQSAPSGAGGSGSRY